MTMPADTRSAELARRFVTDTLAAWGADGFVWDATTVVSELATNAVLHARTEFTVTLSLVGEALRVEVADSSPRLPMARAYGARATTGRGMAVLGALSRAHGVEVVADGKTVWCELAPTGPDDQEAPAIPDQFSEVRSALSAQAEQPRGSGGQPPTPALSQAAGRLAA
jgi:hypothetical protein